VGGDGGGKASEGNGGGVGLHFEGGLLVGKVVGRECGKKLASLKECKE
jgi:hypothetical protein